MMLRSHGQIPLQAQHGGIRPGQKRQTHQEAEETAMVMRTHALVDPHLNNDNKKQQQRRQN